MGLFLYDCMQCIADWCIWISLLQCQLSVNTDNRSIATTKKTKYILKLKITEAIKSFLEGETKVGNTQGEKNDMESMKPY